MKRLVLIMLVIGLLFMVGCSNTEQTTLEQVKEDNTLVVGMSADYKPFEFQDKDGNIIGFDIDILKAITEKLGVELELVNTGFDGLIPGLNSKKYDIIMSAMTITEKRKEAVNFSAPYFDASQVVAVKAENDEITGVADLNDKIIGVQLGTTGDLEASKLDSLKEIKRFDVIPEAFIALKNGQIDAIVNDLPVTKAYVDENPDVKIVGEALTVEQYGIAFRKDDQKLLAEINQALAGIKTDGTYQEVYNKWN